MKWLLKRYVVLDIDLEGRRGGIAYDEGDLPWWSIFLRLWLSSLRSAC